LFAEPPAPPLAGTIAHIASELARNGVQPAPDAIRPLYIRRPDPYRSPNDLYNERNQDRYKSGIKAKPFDVGSPVDTTRSLNGNTTGTINDSLPGARSEHVRWCLKRYKSYAVATNTYVTYEGRTRFCDSPFR